MAGERQLPGAKRTARIASRAGALALFSVLIGLIGGSHAWAGVGLSFPRPASVEPNVQFWVDVFTAYSVRDFIVHDRGQVWKIYQVLQLPGEGAPTREESDGVNAYLRAKYSDMLTRLATGHQPDTYEERKVAELFRGQPLSAYAEAAQDLRVQEGLRERFKEGLLRSRYYWPSMERVFRAAGLPPELVTLATVESGFYQCARSSAGAVGIWQFTRATGRQYLTISSHVDERLNPSRETEAAAKLLRHNYEVLGDWPLAITAYNYGTEGMARAADEYDGDYSRIFQRYSGPHFGFASKNYYAEFLAALQVHRYEKEYFPGIENEEAPPPQTVSDRLPTRPVHKRARLHHISTHARRHRAPTRKV
ncbi:MAG: lytic transglycosylase domain-containing protein [Candidatus Binataceae bacterium]